MSLHHETLSLAGDWSSNGPVTSFGQFGSRGRLLGKTSGKAATIPKIPRKTASAPASQGNCYHWTQYVCMMNVLSTAHGAAFKGIF